MTGKDLIIYILANNLENEPVFKDGKFIGYITVGEAAARENVGMATILALINQERIPYELVRGTVFIPGNFNIRD